MQLSSRIYSGAEPANEADFQQLRSLGFETIVSVDGMKPNLELAQKYNLNYVHIPVGYDGINSEAQRSITQVVRKREGQIYFHCHHGQHRGPAAAATACLAEGSVTSDQALEILERAGTSKNYTGLWRDVANYELPPADAVLPTLVPVAQTSSLVDAMSAAGHAFDNLRLLKIQKWQTPQERPDINAENEVLLMQESLHEANRTLLQTYDQKFKDELSKAEQFAIKLRAKLTPQQGATILNAHIIDEANKQFLLLENSCKQCHKTYRD